MWCFCAFPLVMVSVPGLLIFIIDM
jgi:hypothetical protein